MVRWLLVAPSVVAVVLATGCAHAVGSRPSPHLLDLVASIVARDWRTLTVDVMQKAGVLFERVESRDACDGAVFLQAVEREADGRAQADVTLTLEVTSASPAGHRGACRERLTVITLSRRSDSAATAVRFAELLAARLQLDLGGAAGAVGEKVATQGAYAWSISSASNVRLNRRDLEVRHEEGRWLTRFREFRDDMPQLRERR